MIAHFDEAFEQHLTLLFVSTLMFLVSLMVSTISWKGSLGITGGFVVAHCVETVRVQRCLNRNITTLREKRRRGVNDGIDDLGSVYKEFRIIQ